MNYCSHCGRPVVAMVPAGDTHVRRVCEACGTVHYENPKVVAGCVPEHEGGILLCRRAIEPRLGYWTVPAGFMEIGETLPEAAARETREEALAEVRIGALFAVVDVVHAAQLHVFFEGTLAAPHFGAGAETLEAKLVRPEDIPWQDLAFPSVRIALEQYLENRRSGSRETRLSVAPRLRFG